MKVFIPFSYAWRYLSACRLKLWLRSKICV